MAIANAVNAQTAGVQCLTSAGVWNGRTITAGTGISVSNGDGVSGNPTISATSSDGGTGTVVIYEDFIGGSGSTTIDWFAGNIGWSRGLTGTTYPIIMGTPDSAHPGVLRISCDSNGGENGTLISGIVSGTATGLALGGGAVTYESVIKLAQTGTAAQDFNAYVGIGDLSDGGVEVANGVYFHYNRSTNSGNWIGKTSSASSRNSVNSSVAASTSWIKLGFTVNAAASSVEFFINGSSIGTQTLTIPTSVIGFFFQMDNIAGANDKFMDIDLVTYNQTLTTPR